MMENHATALVVETNYLIAAAVETPLMQSGFHVVVAINETEVLEAFATYSIQIAIIDFRLQYGDADGLVAKLKAANIPYIFCTAASSEEVAEHFPGARVVEKPFGDDMLLSLVTELVGAPR